jgi:hypothetical protein
MGMVMIYALGFIKGAIGLAVVFLVRPYKRPTHVRVEWRVTDRNVDVDTEDRDTRPNVQRSTHLFADSGRFELEVELCLARVGYSVWTFGPFRQLLGFGWSRGPTLEDMVKLGRPTLAQTISVRPGFTKLANVYGEAMAVGSPKDLGIHCARVSRDITVNEVQGSDTIADTVLFLKLCWAHRVLAQGLMHDPSTGLYNSAT